MDDGVENCEPDRRARTRVHTHTCVHTRTCMHTQAHTCTHTLEASFQEGTAAVSIDGSALQALPQLAYSKTSADLPCVSLT